MMQLLQKIFLTHSQKMIIGVSVIFTLFLNYTFFSKLITFGIQEENYFVIFSIPFVFCILSILILNIILLLTYKKSFKIVLIVLFIIGAGSSYFINTFGTVIDKDMFVNVSKTDVAEVFDLLTLKLFFYLFILGVFPSILLWKIPFQSTTYRKELSSKFIMIVVCFACITGIYLAFSKNYSSFFRNHTEMKYYTNPFYPTMSLVKFLYHSSKPIPKLQTIGDDAKITETQNKKRKLIVLVVGETARAENFSLNGYEKQTNQFLSQEANLVNLSDVSSCGTATAISVPCMFSKFAKEDFGDDKLHYENVTDILSKVGVTVLWRDNNSGGTQGIADRIKNKISYGGDSIYDEVMLEGLDKELKSAKGDVLIVLHQEGSHGPTYFKRYPKDFEKFTPVCNTQELEKCTQKEIENTYNNTITYTDYFLDQTIEFLKKNEKEYDTMMLYFSDHGESLGENGIYLHGLPYMLAPTTQTHIPAVVWFGSGFTKERAILDTQKTNHFSHDNIFHTLLGVFGVQTKEYLSSLDFLRVNK